MLTPPGGKVGKHPSRCQDGTSDTFTFDKIQCVVDEDDEKDVVIADGDATWQNACSLTNLPCQLQAHGESHCPG